MVAVWNWTERDEGRRQLRGFCQIVHVDLAPDTVVVDLVVLEPSEGEQVAAGTPLTMAFVATAPEELRDLDATMRGWERACTVLDLAVDEVPDGLRYSFASDVRELILNVQAG